MFARFLAALLTALYVAGTPLAAGDGAVCYGCRPETAGWASILAGIAANTGVVIQPDAKNSEQALAQLMSDGKSPAADVVYYGVTAGIQMKQQGLVQPYKPPGFSDIPFGLRDPDGYWFAVHTGTVGFAVNMDAFKGKPFPRAWKDLLDSQYRGKVGYLDPAGTFGGYAGAVAANYAMGGTLDDFEPGINFFRALQANQPLVTAQIAYARLLSGEIPILIDFDFNAYRARYKDKANVAFVIPAEGTVTVPYVMSLVKGDPNPNNAKKVLDFVLSASGQALLGAGYARPVIGPPPREAAAHFLPALDYMRARTVDYQKMAAVQRTFSDEYRAELR